MTIVLRCECGFTVRADEERELIRRAQQHAVVAHRMTLSDEQILCAAFAAELAAGVWPRSDDPEPSQDGE
jgi:predicted small metal-binding protein